LRWPLDGTDLDDADTRGEKTRIVVEGFNVE
jgi:hypothetical protein